MERYWVPSSLTSALFGTRITDRTFLVRVGGDLAFLNAVQKVILARGWQKEEFVRTATSGFEAYRAALEAQPMEELVAQAGVTLAEIEAFAEEIARAERAVLVWSMGITQHANGGDTVRAIANLALMREYVGRPGTGLMPIRGHSGVQGGAEMGAYATALPGGLTITPENAEHFSRLWGFDVPARPGLATVEMLLGAERGEIDALYSIGGNFLETMPEPPRIERALAQIPLRIHTDLFVTSQMLVEPAEVTYLLPSKTRYEQEGGGTETTTERRVVFSPEIPGHPIGEARAEWRMLLDLARAVRPEEFSKLHCESAAAIRAEIERAVPFYRGIAALAKQGDQFQWGGPMLCTERRFPTADGRAHFQAVSPAGETASNGRDESFLLATRRGKQFNSMIQAEVDPHTGAARDHVFLAPADARRLGLAHDDPIRLENEHGNFRGRAFLADVAPGTLQGHWPEMNVLIGLGPVDPEGGVPDYNARVRLSRAP